MLFYPFYQFNCFGGFLVLFFFSYCTIKKKKTTTKTPNHTTEFDIFEVLILMLIKIR